MPTYLVAGQMTVSCFLQVKADDAKTASEIAATVPPAEWDVEKDGTPEDLTVEEEQ